MYKKFTKGAVCVLVIGGLAAFGVSSASALDLNNVLGGTSGAGAASTMSSAAAMVSAPVTAIVGGTTSANALSGVTSATAPVNAAVTTVVGGSPVSSVVRGSVLKGGVVQSAVRGATVKNVANGSLTNVAQNALQGATVLSPSNFLNPTIVISCNNIGTLGNTAPITGVANSLPLVSALSNNTASTVGSSSSTNTSSNTTCSPTTTTTVNQTCTVAGACVGPTVISDPPVTCARFGTCGSVLPTEIFPKPTSSVGSINLASTGATTAGIGGFAGLLALLAGLSLVVVARKRSVQA